MGRKGHNIVMGLDIGTTKVCAIVGEIQSDGAVNCLGWLCPLPGAQKRGGR